MGTAICFVICGISGAVAALLTFAAMGPPDFPIKNAGWPCFAAWASCFVSFTAGMIFRLLERIRKPLDRIAINGELFNRRYGVVASGLRQSDDAPESNEESGVLNRMTPSQQLAVNITFGVVAMIVVVVWFSFR